MSDPPKSCFFDSCAQRSQFIKLPLRFSIGSCPDSHTNPSVLPVPLHLNQITRRSGCWIPHDQHTPPVFWLSESVLNWWPTINVPENLFLTILGSPFISPEIVVLSTAWMSVYPHPAQSKNHLAVTLLTILYHRQHQFWGNEETKGEATLCLQVYYYWSINSVSERSIVARWTPLPKLSPSESGYVHRMETTEEWV